MKNCYGIVLLIILFNHPARAFLNGSCSAEGEVKSIEVRWQNDQQEVMIDGKSRPAALFRTGSQSSFLSWLVEAEEIKGLQQKFLLRIPSPGSVSASLEAFAVTARSQRDLLGGQTPKLVFKKKLKCHFVETLPEETTLGSDVKGPETGLVATFDKASSPQLVANDQIFPFLTRLRISKLPNQSYRALFRNFVVEAGDLSKCSRSLQIEYKQTFSFFRFAVADYDKKLRETPSDESVLQERKEIQAMGEFLIEVLQKARTEGDECFGQMAKVHLLNSVAFTMERNQNFVSQTRDALLGGFELQLMTLALLQNEKTIRFISADSRSDQDSPLGRRTADGKPLIQGFYNCQNRTMHLDAEMDPSDLAGLFLHEITHFFFDTDGPNQEASASLLLIDETLAAVTAAFFQKAMRVRAGEIETLSTTENFNPLARFFDPVGFFSRAFDVLESGKMPITLQAFMDQTFFAKKNENLSPIVSKMIESSFAEVTKSHFKFASERERDQFSENTSSLALEASFYPLGKQIEKAFTLRLGNKPLSLFSKLSPNQIYYVDTRAGVLYSSNLAEAYGWLQKIVERAEGGASRQCEALTQAAKADDLHGYLGIGVVDEDFERSGRGTIMPGAPSTAMPGRGTVMPGGRGTVMPSAPLRLCIHGNEGI